MNGDTTERAVIAGAVAYLVALAWSMASLPYDIWGAFIIGPILLVGGSVGLRRMFPGRQAELYDVMRIGLIAKLAGGIIRYWVSFDAYGGATDAQRYHTYGARVATDVWTGRGGWSELIPTAVGTEFLEGFTAIVYTVTGTSRLGGFFVFAWISFWGVALFVKAAIIAIPGLARRRYALLMTLAPSIVFWPSSIGKESYLFLMLGLATFGIARFVSRPGFFVSAGLTTAGLGLAALVRPHIAGIWIAGMLPAIAVILFRGRANIVRRSRSRGSEIFVSVVLLGTALLGLSVIASTTLSYLSLSNGDERPSVTEIVAETTRRTSETGSTFQPPAVESPANWPYAAVRTLTRPLLIEARGLGQFLAAVEITVLGFLCAVAWRRLARAPQTLVRVPYVAFALTTLFLIGLAYSTFGNLGVLTRQKSLVFPFLLLLPCLPERAVKRSTTPSTDRHLVQEPAAWVHSLVTADPHHRWQPSHGQRAIADSDDLWGTAPLDRGPHD